ncbi:flagellar hook capping protein [bacterium]|nr:flagellar hook capping protein [bacterium]
MVESVGGTDQGLSQALLGGKDSNSILGKDDFLKLLMAELKHQDPLAPKSDTAFISELANFTSLEQMTNINENFQKFFDNFESNSKMQALSLLGTEVVANNPSTEEGAEATISGIVNKMKFEDDEAQLYITTAENQEVAVTLDDLVEVGLGDFFL